MTKVSHEGVEKIKTHILCLITFFRKTGGVCEMWKNIVRLDRRGDGVARNPSMIAGAVVQVVLISFPPSINLTACLSLA
jgi:hypothetical protein